MKANKLLSISLSILLLTSCGSSKKAQQNSSQEQYPNYGGYQPQPGHYQQGYQGIYQHPQQDNYQQQIGYRQQYQSQDGPDAAGFIEVKKSPIEELSLALGTDEIRAFGAAESGNEQMALNAARAQATAALQEKIEVYVRAGLDQYVEETGVNGEYSLDETTRNQVMTAVKGIVTGATVLDYRKMYNPNTKRYKYEVCMKYDRAGILSVMQQQSDRIRSNEKRFEEEMQQAWDALDAENNRVSLGEQQQARENAMQQENLDRQHDREMERQEMMNQIMQDQQTQSTNNQQTQNN